MKTTRFVAARQPYRGTRASPRPRAGGHRRRSVIQGSGAVGPGRVTLSSAPRKLEPPVLRRPPPASASPPAAANSDTGVPKFVMEVTRSNRR